jgi:hypothetical protein
MKVIPCKKSDCTNVTCFLGVDDVIALAKKNNEHLGLATIVPLDAGQQSYLLVTEDDFVKAAEAKVTVEG